MTFFRAKAVRVSGLPAAMAALALLVPPVAAQESEVPGRAARLAPALERGPEPRRDRVAREAGPAPVRGPAASQSLGEFSDGQGYVLESGPVSFGDVLPGVESEIPGAIRVRVFSDREWVLKLVAITPMQIAGRSEPVPVARLAWRSRRSGGFVPFSDGRPATVARGSRTGGAGELVVVDVRLRLAPADELGRYGCDLKLLLEDG